MPDISGDSTLQKSESGRKLCHDGHFLPDDVQSEFAGIIGSWDMGNFQKAGLGMSRHQRIEPTFSGTSEVKEDSYPAISNQEPDNKDQTHPSLKLAALAIVVAGGVYIGDSALDSYREYQAMQFLNAQMEQLQNEMESAQRIARARFQQQRQARADTHTGKWLEKNCADWRRSHSANPLPTSAAEMKRHCGAYEQYLDTGIAPVGLR